MGVGGDFKGSFFGWGALRNKCSVDLQFVSFNKYLLNFIFYLFSK